MYKILTLNNISVSSLERLPRDCSMRRSIQNLTRCCIAFLHHTRPYSSCQLQGGELRQRWRQHIPVTSMTAKGIWRVQRAGANANAVKKPVIAGMLIAERNIYPIWNYTCKLQGADAELSKHVRVRQETNRTLSVTGLGAIQN